MFFYTDPYSPWERGSNEINNRFLRKEITKGQAINDYSSAQIIATNNWMNHYPRAMFNDLCTRHIRNLTPGDIIAKYLVTIM